MNNVSVVTRQLASPAETQAWGERLGSLLAPGNIVLLDGEMGSGKTTLAKGICAGLGLSSDSVTSPTYTIVHIYPGKIPVHHTDLYRLESLEQLDAFDPEELTPSEGISLIEWPSLIRPQLPEEALLEVGLTTHPDSREVRLEVPEALWSSAWEALAR
jgi:tRNA threonylcarbamoyladenosine biosynthesis protein TsaE